MSLKVLISEKRKAQSLKTAELSFLTGIDQALISKFEHGKRIPTKEQGRALSEALNIDYKQLETLRLAEKIMKIVRYEPLALEAMHVAESRVEYLTGSKRFSVPELSPGLAMRLSKIDTLRDEWISKKPLNTTQLSKIGEFFKVQYTFDSNRIEGNTLTLQETGLVINEGVTIGGKSLREHLEAINHAEAVEFVQELMTSRAAIAERNILELHALVLKGIDRENAGKYRSVNVRISGSEHVPPEPYAIPQLMGDYMEHYRMQKGSMHPVILAAEMHERLVSIHPFVDGNGRTSRLVMNLVLLQHGYTLANLKGDNVSRLRYYKALEQVQQNANPEPFYELVAEAVETSLREHLSLV